MFSRLWWLSRSGYQFLQAKKKLRFESFLMKNKIFATQKLRILRPGRIAREKLIYDLIKHFLALICIP
jgi:hypothetical protein